MIRIATVNEIPNFSLRVFAVGESRIAVYHVDGSFYAIDDVCSHAEAYLSEGDFDAEELTAECPMHGSRFDLRTGRPLTLPAFEPVRTYQVVVEGDALFLAV